MEGSGDSDPSKKKLVEEGSKSPEPSEDTKPVDASKLFHDRKFSLEHYIPNPGPLLGVQEMEKYLGGRTAIIQVTTWNMGSLPIPKDYDLRKLFYHDQDETMKKVDIHAISIQECWPDTEAWEVALQKCFGPDFAIMDSQAFGTLHLSIIMRRDLLWFVSDPQWFTLRVRTGRLFKTKGASGIYFGFFGFKFSFISAHLSAGTDEINMMQRIDELRKILTGENREKQFSHCDGIFLAGDLNFRILGLKREEIFECLTKNDLEPLLQHDELNLTFRHRNTLPRFLQEFQEAAGVTFRPTYKYDIGTDIFDTTPTKRAPAYTDRILYRGKEMSDSNFNIECLAYEAVTKLRTSDHKPVYAVFAVHIKPGHDTLPLSGCQFRQDIYIKGVQARAKYLLERKKKLGTTICTTS